MDRGIQTYMGKKIEIYVCQLVGQMNAHLLFK